MYREIKETAQVYTVQSWQNQDSNPEGPAPGPLLLATRLYRMQSLPCSEVRPAGVEKKEQKQMGGDFPGGAVVKTLCSQCRGPGFDPWSGN